MEVSRIDELLVCQERIPSVDYHRRSAQTNSSTSSFSSSSSTSSVYIDDDKVFYNLILKEALELEQRAWRRRQQEQRPALGAQLSLQTSNKLRHSILSWMLDICVLKQFQDDIFPYGAMILDKFLLARQQPAGRDHQRHQEELAQRPAGPAEAAPKRQRHEPEPAAAGCEPDQLRLRQLYQFAACSLLVATKMRQTRPRSKSFIDELAEFSRARLGPVGLTSDEIRQAEYLLLFSLNWDYALVTPNDYLPLLMRKCEKLLFQSPASVLERTQELLELCLMNTQLSQYAPSILAMSSMVVAINGLNTIEGTCWSLDEIAAQIHECTYKVNDFEQMIDVALKIRAKLSLWKRRKY